jgi:multiple sugar transport system ATP-binding protein
MRQRSPEPESGEEDDPVATITFTKVCKRYPDGTEAVRDFDLEVADGEFLVLVGPSGCGKTTVLRMLAGLEAITQGELLIDGKRANDLQPRERDIAMVFQSYALYPHMTVAKNMGFGLRRAGLPKEEVRRKVEEAARTLGIFEQLDRKPANLSGGQRQRVAMGRAIVREPVAFLMDEPLSNLDARLRVQMRAEIGRIQRRLSTTTVYVTHDQTEAMTLGDRLVVMRDGVIQQVGTPDELYSRPRNLFVAGFIGAPSMNLLEGTVEAGQLRTSLATVPLDDDLRRRLDGHDPGRALIVGIRPEDFEDASLVGEQRHGHVLTAVVDVLEATGSDVYAHLLVERSGAAARDAAAMAIDAQQEESSITADVVARLDASSALREGEPAKLWLDTGHIHLFDADTGERLQTKA